MGSPAVYPSLSLFSWLLSSRRFSVRMLIICLGNNFIFLFNVLSRFMTVKKPLTCNVTILKSTASSAQCTDSAEEIDPSRNVRPANQTLRPHSTRIPPPPSHQPPAPTAVLSVNWLLRYPRKWSHPYLSFCDWLCHFA